MTDSTQQPGSAPAGNPGSSASVQVTGDQGSSVIASDAGWLTGLQDAGNRELAAKKGWDKSKSPDVVFTSYRELESRLGKSIVIPDANAPREDYDKLYGALGKPKTPGEYDFRLPQGISSDFPYDDSFATEYKTWAHSADLSNRQAQVLHDQFVGRHAKMMVDAQAAQTRKVSTAHGEITRAWGPEETVGYKRNVDLASRAIRKLGLLESFRSSGLLTAKGEITDSKLAFALATVGEGLYREDNAHGNPGSSTASNPWKAGQENLSEQGRIHKENPELARTLVIAAGLDPEKALYRRR